MADGNDLKHPAIHRKRMRDSTAVTNVCENLTIPIGWFGGAGPLLFRRVRQIFI